LTALAVAATIGLFYLYLLQLDITGITGLATQSCITLWIVVGWPKKRQRD